MGWGRGVVVGKAGEILMAQDKRELPELRGEERHSAETIGSKRNS